MHYINIHSHQPQAQQQTTILNLHDHFEEVEKPGLYSIGLHPWYITNNWQQQFQQLKKYAAHPHILAIGECGLDKVCDTDFQLQQQCFASQVQLANECNKPLIIHCVKAFDEVLTALKHAKVPAIFHGFAKSQQLAQQIISAGHYISFGTAFKLPRMQEVIRSMPLEKIFLETDDASVTIKDVYQYAAQALSINIDLLSLQIQKNAHKVFNNKI